METTAIKTRSKKTAKPSIWNVEVSCLRDGCTSDDKYGRRSPVISGADSIGEAIASGIRSATYYLGIGYQGVMIGLTELCGECRGRGEHSGSMTKRWKPCKACNATGELSSIPAFAVECSDSVKIIDHANIMGRGEWSFRPTGWDSV